AVLPAEGVELGRLGPQRGQGGGLALRQAAAQEVHLPEAAVVRQLLRAGGRDGEHGVVGGGVVQVEVVAGDIGGAEVLQEGGVGPVEGAVVGREPPARVDL